MFHIYSIFVFIVSLWAFYKIYKSMAETKIKILWVAIIVVFQIIGLIVWFIMGPGDKQLNL